MIPFPFPLHVWGSARTVRAAASMQGPHVGNAGKYCPVPADSRRYRNVEMQGLRIANSRVSMKHEAVGRLRVRGRNINVVVHGRYIWRKEKKRFPLAVGKYPHSY